MRFFHSFCAVIILYLFLLGTFSWHYLSFSLSLSPLSVLDLRVSFAVSFDSRALVTLRGLVVSCVYGRQLFLGTLQLCFEVCNFQTPFSLLSLVLFDLLTTTIATRSSRLSLTILQSICASFRVTGCQLEYQSPILSSEYTNKPKDIKQAGKLDPYASPPISPQSHCDPVQKDSSAFFLDRSGGMDGDFRRDRHDEQSQIPSTFRMGRSTVPRPSAGATNRFRQANTLSTASGDATELPQASGRAMGPSYVGYGYTDTSFQGASLQQGSQLQPFSQSFLPHQRPQQQEENPAYPYSQEVAYSFHQQQQQHNPAQGSYDAVPQYPTRQPVATIDALSDQFPVPQYFATGEPTGAAANGIVSHYMNPSLPHSTSYNYPGFLGRSSATVQSFPTNMASLTTPVGPAMERLEQQHSRLQSQPQPQSQPVTTEPTTTTGTNLDEAYKQFQRALRSILDHSRAGRLVEAGRSLLEISEWLVTNARELGTLSLFASHFLHFLETTRCSFRLSM